VGLKSLMGTEGTEGGIVLTAKGLESGPPGRLERGPKRAQKGEIMKKDRLLGLQMLPVNWKSKERRGVQSLLTGRERKALKW